MVAVITDSIASLPAGIKEELDIQIVPIFLNVDGQAIGEDAFTDQELLDREVKTSAPSPGAFLTAIEEAQTQKGASQILLLTVSKKLSSSYASALVAAEEASNSSEVSEIRVIDTQSASAGQGLIVLDIARYGQAGASLAELSARAEQLCKRVRLVGVLADVKQLVKTGRIPKIAGWASNRLGVRPLFEIREGQIKRMVPAFSLKSAHQKIVEICKNSHPNIGANIGADAGADISAELHLGIVHSGNLDDAKKLEELVQSFTLPKEKFTARFNQSLIAAAGTGVSGIAWYWEVGTGR